MKINLKFFYPPLTWRLPVIILLGIFAGLSIYSFYLSKAWSYLSDNPQNCINCHIMVPQYATWRHSSHKEVANCVDCHVPHNNIFNQYFFKAKDGFNHAKLFTLRAERQAIIIGSEGEKAVQQNCIRCHENLLDRSKIKSKTSNKYIAHNKNRKCWDCHKEVPHGKNRSLSSTPHAIVPKLESPVPDWLKSFVKK